MLEAPTELDLQLSSLSQISDQKTVGWLTGRKLVVVVAEEVVAVKAEVLEGEAVQEVGRTRSRKRLHNLAASSVMAALDLQCIALLGDMSVSGSFAS